MDLPKRSEVKTESPIEEMLYQELQNKGFYPIPQFKVGKYRIDLAFPEKMIAIECDGQQWHSTFEQKERDEKKDAFLKQCGWAVYRVTGSDIYEYASSIAEIVGYGYKPRLPKKWDGMEIDYDLDTYEEIEYKEQFNKQLYLETLDEQKETPVINIQDILNKKRLSWK